MDEQDQPPRDLELVPHSDREQLRLRTADSDELVDLMQESERRPLQRQMVHQVPRDAPHLVRRQHGLRLQGAQSEPEPPGPVQLGHQRPRLASEHLPHQFQIPVSGPLVMENEPDRLELRLGGQQESIRRCSGPAEHVDVVDVGRDDRAALGEGRRGRAVLQKAPLQPTLDLCPERALGNRLMAEIQCPAPAHGYAPEAGPELFPRYNGGFLT